MFLFMLIINQQKLETNTFNFRYSKLPLPVQWGIDHGDGGKGRLPTDQKSYSNGN